MLRFTPVTRFPGCMKAEAEGAFVLFKLADTEIRSRDREIADLKARELEQDEAYDAVLKEKNEEIGALQEQLAAEKIEGGRLRGDIRNHQAAIETHYSGSTLPITGILHADALDPDERVELAEDRPGSASAAHRVRPFNSRDSRTWNRVTLYAPATLEEPPYPWKRVVRGSRDEEIHRKAGWADLAEMTFTEPEQIPLSRSYEAGKRATIEETLAELLTVNEGVDVRLDMLDEDVERLKNRGTVAAALDAAILHRVQALEARCPGHEDRLAALESQSKHTT